MLFSNQKRRVLSIPTTKDDGKPVNIAFLVDYLVKNVMKDPRKELFVLDNQVYVCLLPSHLSSALGASSSHRDSNPHALVQCEHWSELFTILTLHSRPGILVLINDADWELEGEETYEIQNGDEILFVSTLHGG